MIELNIPIKPLSVNEVWAGRRFKTPAYKRYELEFAYLLPFAKEPVDGWVNVRYEYGLPRKTFALADTGNFEKPISDIIVKRGYIRDDRYIIELSGKKVLSDSFYVKVWITCADSPY